MKLRKGVVPLILFVLLAAGVGVYMVMSNERVPMENGESIFDQP